MDDAVAVGVFEDGADLAADPGGVDPIREGQVVQRRTFDQLHDDEGGLAGEGGIVDPDDARMVDARRRARLVQQA